MFADTYASGAQGAALIGRQGADLVGDRGTGKRAASLVQAPGDAAGRPGHGVRLAGLAQGEERGEDPFDMGADLGFDCALGAGHGFVGAQFAADHADGGFERGGAGDQLGDGFAIPDDLTVIGKSQL